MFAVQKRNRFAALVLFTSVTVLAGCGKKADSDPPSNTSPPGAPPPSTGDAGGGAPGALPADIVGAWEKAGAKLDVSSITDGHLLFQKPFGRMADGAIPSFGITQWKPGMFESLPAPNVPFALSLRSSGLTDAGLKELARFPHLVHVNLFDTKITRDGFKEFVKQHPNIRALYLGSTNIDDEWLKALAASEHLVHLDLSHDRCTVTDAGVAALGNLKKLEALRITSEKVTDAGAKTLAGLNLLHLGLACSALTDAALADLTGLKSLQSLSLYTSKVTDAGLKHLVALGRLEDLNLSATNVTDAGVKNLLALKNLKKLHLSSIPLTDEGLKGLAGLPSLVWLQVNFTMVTPVGKAELKKQLPKLVID